MSYERLAKALLKGEVYFGSALRALQVPLERYAYLDAITGQMEGGASRALRLLEVGSWAGGSTIALGNALARRGWEGTIECVDQWQPYFEPKDDRQKPSYSEMNEATREGTIYPLFLHNIAAAGIDRRIEIHRGASSAILPTLPKSCFDLVFIDGSHYYDDVLADISLACPLVRDGGIICGDDLEMQAGDVNPQELKDALASGVEYLSVGDPVRYGYHPGVTAAISAIFGRVSCWAAVWAMRRRGDQWEPVVLSEIEKIAIPPQFDVEWLSQDKVAAATQALVDTMRAELSALRAQHDRALAELSAVKKQSTETLAELCAAQKRHAETSVELNKLREQYAAALAELSAVYQSTSWKATEPARRLIQAARGFVQPYRT